MKIKFYKYQAAGDDFIVLDNMDGKYDAFLLDIEAKQRICNRQKGVGSNGIIELKHCSDAAYEVVFHTPEGVTAGLCGNGTRNSLAYATAYFLTKSDDIIFRADDGIHKGSYDIDTHIAKISFLDIPKDILKFNSGQYVFTGLPHFIKYFEDNSNIDVIQEGARLSNEAKHLSKYKVIINFVVEKDDGLYPRCFDPNSSAELTACGSASVACALGHIEKNGVEEGKAYSVPVHWRMGDILTVSFTVRNDKFVDITLTGPAKQVYEGVYEYEPTRNQNEHW